MVIENEDEEQAYEEIKNVFGIDPVKFTKEPKEMKYIQMELDENLQVAEILYSFDDKNMLYIISADYKNSSMGIDVEDRIIEKEKIQVNGNMIELTEYAVESSGEIKCSAKYDYKGLEYFLIGTVEKDDFELILGNLFFY